MKTILNQKNDCELKKIQLMLLNQMERLNDDEVMKLSAKKEVMRSGALSQSVCAYVKSINTQAKILELSGKYNVNVEDMNNYLGINNEKEN